MALIHLAREMAGALVTLRLRHLARADLTVGRRAFLERSLASVAM